MIGRIKLQFIILYANLLYESLFNILPKIFIYSNYIFDLAHSSFSIYFKVLNTILVLRLLSIRLAYKSKLCRPVCNAELLCIQNITHLYTHVINKI